MVRHWRRPLLAFVLGVALGFLTRCAVSMPDAMTLFGQAYNLSHDEQRDGLLGISFTWDLKTLKARLRDRNAVDEAVESETDRETEQNAPPLLRH